MALINKQYTILILALLLHNLTGAQDCTLTIAGKVQDADTGYPLQYVNVFIEESLKGAVTDSMGTFEIQNICPGHTHITLSHIGCESVRQHIDLDQDTSILFTMDHARHVLEGITVEGSVTPNTLQTSESVNEKNITDQSNAVLGNMLEQIAGVTTLKNGSGIAKPVIHGLYGNRITILNNGVRQSGQQWGNDHSPEIDALVADKLKVIKGTASLQYQGDNLGGMVLVVPGRIEKEPHLHGKASYFYQTNGRGHNTHFQMQKYDPRLSWKVLATAKKRGDQKSASYFLTNTGAEELNIALQLEKEHRENWHSSLYISSYNTTIGILRGSHIGNTTDLELAIAADVPFFTRDTFSYQIVAPQQEVHHHLAKLSSKLFMENTRWLEFTLAAQLNDRQEFDSRRSGLSDLPALSLQQYTYDAELKYNQEQNDNSFSTGIQVSLTNNTNDPETGVLPLIPDYLSGDIAVFAVRKMTKEKWMTEYGVRYKYARQEALTIGQTIPREIIRYNKDFHNLSVSGGLRYLLNNYTSLSINTGLATRQPAINELYSAGLHQGVSGIEEGDPELSSERSFKSILSLETRKKNKLAIELHAYYQRVDDYIYLQPQDEFRLTIRGAFPVFAYRQDDARIYGFDFIGNVHLTKPLSLGLNYSYIRGDNLSEDIPLVNMPSNNLKASLSYAILKMGNIENVEMTFNYNYRFRQDHLLADQDYVLPPNAYQLAGLQLSAEWPLRSNRLRIVLRAENLFNTRYRDYLNRLRYFADDVGRNLIAGLSFKF